MTRITPVVRLVFAVMSLTIGAHAQSAFYVSPTGSDMSTGTAPDRPFQTLEQAQSAMQALGTAPATTYLEAGTYRRTQALILTNYNDRNKSWVNYQHQAVTLTGGRAADIAILIGEPGITIQGLSIRYFTRAGIFATYADHLNLTLNTIIDITTPDWRTNVLGASIFMLRVRDSRITRNTIIGNTYIGIQVNGGGRGDNNSNDIIANNVIMNTCTVVNDCGAIDFRDVGHVSTGQIIWGNTIFNFGNPSNQTKGIYLDDETSNVLVADNNVFGTGTWGLQIHGGDHNTIVNNIFDISDVTKLGLYQDEVGSGGINYGMTGNKFYKNIVYSASVPAGDLWDYIDQSGKGIAVPAVTRNLYFSPAGTLPDTGAILDSSPIVADPLFGNAPAHDYQLKAGSPALALGFKRTQ